MERTELKPHKVLGRTGYNGDLHALVLTEGPFSGIVFSYTNVSFTEENLDNEDKLKIHFEYDVHEVPADRENYNKEKFEAELGEFIIQLLYYGLEKDFLGYVDTPDEHNRENNSEQFSNERAVLPEGGTVS